MDETIPAGEQPTDRRHGDRRHGDRRQAADASATGTSTAGDSTADASATGTSTAGNNAATTAGTAATAAVARRWAAAWSSRDLGALFQLMAAGVAIESNLDPDGDFVEVMCDLAAAVDRVDVVSEVVAPDGQVALIYDCAGPAGTVRVAEFLGVREGLVVSVRRVYDVVAAQRALTHTR